MSTTPAPQPPTGLLADGRLSYTFEGRPHAISGSHLSHHDLARKVRVLGRLDLNHEAVCIMARDRIAHLAERVDYLSNERFDLNRHYFDGGWDAAILYSAVERDELKEQIAENVKAMERATEFVKRAEADRNFERECLAEVEEDREAMRLAFMEVIDFAIELGREAPIFLAAWREGDTVEGVDTRNEWADFRAWRKSRQEERLRVALYGDAKKLSKESAPERDRLVEALRRSAQGWANVIELGLLPAQHVATAQEIHDEARAALSAETGR